MPESQSAEETRRIGKESAATLSGGDIVTFEGDLGAGKTTLIKGIAEHFGIDDVVSPTFTLMQVYEKTNQEGITLVHVDTYRLETEQDLIDIGIEDYLGDPKSICLIEWPEKIKGLLEKHTVRRMLLEHTGETSRTVTEQ